MEKRPIQQGDKIVLRLAGGEMSRIFTLDFISDGLWYCHYGDDQTIIFNPMSSSIEWIGLLDREEQ